MQLLCDQLNNELPEYTLVTLKGIFDNDKEVFVGPRMLIQDSVPKRFTKNLPWPVGYNVITPMRLYDVFRQTVLINRGWIPKEKLYSGARDKSQLDGIVEIQALVRTTNEESMLIGKPKPKTSNNNNRGPKVVVFNQKNRVEISKLLGTSQWLADQTFDGKVAELGGPLGGQTRVVLRNDHSQYIFTWFALGIATTFLWVKQFRM